jgi:hypothetical protein
MEVSDIDIQHPTDFPGEVMDTADVASEVMVMLNFQGREYSEEGLGHHHLPTAPQRLSR